MSDDDARELRNYAKMLALIGFFYLIEIDIDGEPVAHGPPGGETFMTDEFRQFTQTRFLFDIIASYDLSPGVVYFDPLYFGL